MSKIRENIPIPSGDLATPVEGDLVPYVIFTQLKAGGPFIYAGWLDAIDKAMAVQFGREHYGQDQQCTVLWAIPRSAIAGTEPEHPTSRADGPPRAFQVFTRRGSGDVHESTITVEAPDSERALQAARQAVPDGGSLHSIWVVPCDAITATGQDDLIWRHTDQSYRLARGYSRSVREKWERIRAERDLEQYEKDDLKEAF